MQIPHMDMECSSPTLENELALQSSPSLKPCAFSSICSHLCPSAQPEAAAGHAPGPPCAVASFVGMMNRQRYFGSHSSLFQSRLHSPAVPPRFCIRERTCQLLDH